jgi:ankyrin repeat protein
VDTIAYSKYVTLSHLTRNLASDICIPLASAGHEEIVVDLLGAGADINRANDKGLTAL